MKSDNTAPFHVNFVGKIVGYFASGNVAILLTIAFLVFGISALIYTPQEEEPQIIVPIADIYVDVPGSEPEEVERLVSTPLEQLLWQIDGVEYVYSTSMYDRSVISVRFFVGEDRERSWVKLYNKINSHIDMAPNIVKGWVIKPVEIDDVPIISLTLHTENYDDRELRQVAEELRAHLEEVEDISRTRVAGGRREQVQIDVLPEKLESRGLSLLEVQKALVAANSQLPLGDFHQLNQNYDLRSGPIIEDVDQLKTLVVGTYDNKPVYLQDIAHVSLKAEEPTSYSRITINDQKASRTSHAVTVELAKKKGANAVSVADNILLKLEELKATVIPDGIEVDVTRNYGDTAEQKINELLGSLLFAIMTIVIILVLSLGWREGLIVALAVPLSFSMALFTNYLFGYTLNRVTLFALILTLGLVVDDPITNVDNIQRHILRRIYKPLQATIYAVQEVFTPVVVSTLTIIVSFLPMFYITGMMGPYMEPMAINVPLAVTFSTIVAITIVPWATYHLLKNKKNKEKEEKQISSRWYRKFLGYFLSSKALRWTLLVVVLSLLGVSGVLVITKKVPLKMLPFDNKNELQLVINMPEGTTLEKTDQTVRAFESYLERVPEVTNFVSYIGTHSPIDFNGLVRHQYFRNNPYQADIRINFFEKNERSMQSHEIALRIRNDLEAIARQYGATLAITESPPGPPVFSTVVAEIYGPPEASFNQLIEGAEIVKQQMFQQEGMVDIDTSKEDSHPMMQFDIDREKAAIHGIHTDTITSTLRTGISGSQPTFLHTRNSRTPIPIHLQLPKSKRSHTEDLSRVTIKDPRGNLIPLGELGQFVQKQKNQPIYHKNLKRVVYVFAEMAGIPPANGILELQSYFSKNPLPFGLEIEWAGEGEWFITLRVFRDLGIAFFAALIGIYFILTLQTGSYFMPLVLMSAIPLSAIGILPGFYLLNLLTNETIGGYQNPTFFTATAMIGMIALGGIVVRNSSVLITFIEDKVSQGIDLREAILLSGETRMRPILLTAITTAVGVVPITFDPIFSGLGWALIFGLFVSTLFSLVVVPVIYWSYYNR